VSARQRASRKARVRGLVKTLGRRLGVEIAHYRPEAARRATLIDRHHISLVLDVGANTGQYATELRDWGYRGEIISFEPLSAAFAQLELNASADPHWHCRRIALGPSPGRADLKVAQNSVSSSLLSMADRHVDAQPDSAVVAVEQVEVVALDSLGLLEAYKGETLLKLDVQGYEEEVLRGAGESLANVRLVECELTVAPLYEGQALLGHMMNVLGRGGFELIALSPGFYDVSTGEILQYNGMFTNTARCPVG